MSNHDNHRVEVVQELLQKALGTPNARPSDRLTRLRVKKALDQAFRAGQKEQEKGAHG